MSKFFRSIFRFLPVQLFLLHFRKYQLLLVFWIILFSTVAGHFASAFGASSLFLAPEYLGTMSFTSMLLLGCAVGVFIMAWHITTFIINNTRIPFMGAIRYAFIKYCMNNSIIPLMFLVYYSVMSIRFQLQNEHANTGKIILYQFGFYLGIVLIILISFAYFFRVGRDMLKVLLSRITNPAIIKDIIPYDSLDYHTELIKADTFLTGRLKIKKFSDLQSYHPRFLNTVLRKHSRNATTATIFALLVLVILGLFMENPLLRIPAAAGFLLLFSVIMGLVGSVKYFLRSWEVFGWMFIALVLSWLVKEKIFDFRSIAYGMDYRTAEKPEYDYKSLRRLFTPQRYNKDKQQEESRLDNWKTAQKNEEKPPLVIITASGGGSRASYWTLHSLQYIDSITGGKLFDHSVLLTGASGGMSGAVYWRTIHNSFKEGRITTPYNPQYLENISKDLLNSIIFSLASVDLISPFNKISLAGYSYTKDRGYAMEQEMIRNTAGMLDLKLGDCKHREASGKAPMLIVNGTIINDGRRLMMCAQPVSYLTQSEQNMRNEDYPPIDAVDFAEFFKDQNPLNLRMTTALRMNATFPYILPVVRLPSEPTMNIMDAGLRDNFGTETAGRYLYVLREWLKKNAGKVIMLQIRDTREYEIFPSTEMNTLGKMAADPLFVIQNKWEIFQSYNQNYMRDYMKEYMGDQLEFVTLKYIPEKNKKGAALNFHLTSREKEDIYKSIFNKENQEAVKKLEKLLGSN